MGDAGALYHNYTLYSVSAKIDVWSFTLRDWGRLRLFCSLWPWPWLDDLHIRTRPLSPKHVPADQKLTSYVKAFESYCITDRQTDRQMPPKIYRAASRVAKGFHCKSSGCQLRRDYGVVLPPSIRYLPNFCTGTPRICNFYRAACNADTV